MTNEMPFRPVNWGGQNPHGATTGWIQGRAGSGHWTERRRRGAATQFPVHLERVASPLDVDTAYNFGAEFEANERTKGHPIAAGVGGVLGYHLVKAAMRRRGLR
jgi:hypothetical protein